MIRAMRRDRLAWMLLLIAVGCYTLHLISGTL